LLTLDFSLHAAQQEIFNSPARFKAVVAGRRFGKSHLMAVWLLCRALENRNAAGHELTSEHETIYIAPTFAQAHGMFWPKLKKLAEPITEKAMENTGILYLTNGRRIRLFGMDNPDAARGVAIGAVGFDEYADMPARAWKEVIRPALMDVEGEAMFIGTPKGKNHFYELFLEASVCEDGTWQSFNYSSHDNPLISSKELADITRDMSSDQVRQEIEASFTSAEGKVFRRDWFRFGDEPGEGIWHIAVDLAGFTPDEKNKKDMKRRDETAIAVVKSHPGGWWVKEIVHGQWDTRETAMKILQIAREVQASTVGIEKGALMNAVMPYMNDVMRRYGRYLNLIPLTHGNQQKTNRINWALQGRLEKGRVTFNRKPSDYRGCERWFDRLVDQAMDFPDKRAKDDLLDSLAYIDQLDKGYVSDFDAGPTWQAQDLVAGY
jgi:hypothetical protein